ncbi:MAG TPA: universal stress protein [Gemmatimonadales bacterium]|nr:universal stress protein [Gemmatimonadales bacterium]
MRTQFRSILVPLDSSATAEQALSVGASLARRAGAPLHLVSVQEPVPAAVTAEAGQYGVEFGRESRAELSRYLADTLDTVRVTQDIPVHGEVLDGTAADAVADYVARHDIGLVVMTTHARTGFKRLVLGSVADQLRRRVSRPVLLLHPSDLPQPTRFRRILIALDGQIEAPVLEPAVALGSLEEGAEYVLFRAAEPPVPLLTALGASSPSLGRARVDLGGEDAARNHLERVANRLRALGLTVTWRVVRARDVREQAIEIARDTGADCIAVGTRGASGIERMVVGSVADRVVRRTELPVLVGPVGHR